MNQALIPVLIEAALRSLALSLAVWAGMRLFRVSNVLARKAAWGLVLAAAMAMPALMRIEVLPPGAAVRLAFPALQTAQSPIVAPATLEIPATSELNSHPAPTGLPIESRFSDSRSSDSSVDDSGAQSVIQTPPPISRSTAQPTPPASTSHASVNMSPANLAWMLYLAVAGALLLRLFYGVALAVDLWRTAQPVSHTDTAALANLRVRASSRVSSPLTIGSGVLLPADYAEWPAEKLRVVLAHERSHIRQRDFYLQLVSALYAAIFWFSPLGWWLKRILSDLGETISDRAGLELAASRSAYARILLEFAAMPRPTLIGVAMARPSSLSHRIERLLNDASFRQAFAGGRRRALLAVLLVPVALFATTALVRVEAAGQASPQAVPPAQPDASVTGQSHPEQVTDQVAAPAPADAQPPSAPAVPSLPPAPPDSAYRTVVPNGMAPVSPAPPAPGGYSADQLPMVIDDNGKTITIIKDRTNTTTSMNMNMNLDMNADMVMRLMNGKGNSYAISKGYSYGFSNDGETWAIVNKPGEGVRFSGDWNNGREEEIKKAAALAHGKFLWFTHDGKSYVVDDPEILSQIEAMYQPMEALGKQQKELGERQRELGKQQQELGMKQRQASIPTPDISKEMARLNEALARLKAKEGSTVSRDELAELQARLGEIQGKLGELQGAMGGRQGEFGSEMGKLGEEQGKLGAEQGKLGAEQGRIAQEANVKVKKIITDSLQNGKARPVQ